jgi:hypothetical protein
MPKTADPTTTMAPRPAPPPLPDWTRAMDRVAEEEGYLEPVGANHFAFFYDDGPTLLVTFDRAEDIRSRPDRMPEAFRLAKSRGWSLLSVIADGATWYRDPRVFGYFDRLVDDAFMEDFDRVVFFGADMGAYAAAAFSVTAPGATILAISPRATLDPDWAGWDHRDPGARRLVFTDRYGFAPDMTEGAGDMFLVFDPEAPEEAMHRALFHAPWVTGLSARHTGGQAARVLKAMDVIEPMIVAAVEGRLSALAFARLWRARRRNPAYLSALLDRAEERGEKALIRRLCRAVVAAPKAPDRFVQRLAALGSGR